MSPEDEKEIEVQKLERSVTMATDMMLRQDRHIRKLLGIIFLLSVGIFLETALLIIIIWK